MNYKEFSKDTQKTMKVIESYLEEKYGSVESQWNMILYLLADNIDLYLNVKKELKVNGLFNKDTYKKNPLISTLKDIQATVLKQIQQLGLSPYASAKINVVEEDKTDDFIESLIND